MRASVFCCFLLLAIGSPLQEESPAADTNRIVTPAAPPDIATLHQAWQAEHDPAKRHDLAGQLVEAVIHDYNEQQPEIVDEVARDGVPVNEIKSASPARKVTLAPVTVLTGATAGPDEYPRSPVFRRMTAKRLEVWTPKEGWLFDEKGKTLADVNVPRRDGQGREWFGAFLPDGTWITTDIWSDDKQVNCYSPKGQWKWELDGAKILARLPKPKANSDSVDEPIRPSIGWARADKTGKRWLISIGTDWSTECAFVTPTHQVLPFPENVSLWHEVYPRAMSVRGMYIALGIDSDDGKVNLGRSEAGHGVEVGWPRYSWVDTDEVVIPAGNDQFGFWPHSHDVFIEAEGATYQASHRVWFFDAKGKYEGEVTGSYLVDAANGSDLLVRGADDGVVQVSRAKGNLAVSDSRSFTWPDGSQAVPLAIYDDLKLGFFLRGPGISGVDDANGQRRRARASAETVLARW